MDKKEHIFIEQLIEASGCSSGLRFFVQISQQPLLAPDASVFLYV